MSGAGSGLVNCDGYGSRMAGLAGAVGATGAIRTPRFAKLARIAGLIYRTAAVGVSSSGAVWTGVIHIGGVGAVDSSI